jgi:gamma-glutamyltranspeptidase/glutathione hydrolase
MNTLQRYCHYFTILIFSSSCATLGISSPTSDSEIIAIAPRSKVEATGQKWVVSTQGRHTTEIAHQILKSGGNLMDAAIAASLAISVERPHSTGIGGGGFLIYHEAKSGKNFVYDFRERAPLTASKNMYLNAKGDVIPDQSSEGALSIGTPGLIKGLIEIHKKHGTKKWADLVIPAANLAKNGFEIYPNLALAIADSQDTLKRFPSSAEIFLNHDSTIANSAVWSPKKLNERLIQTDLANTLMVLSENPMDFYQGQIAKKIIASVQSEKGILSQKDLLQYTVRQRTALKAKWLGYDIVSMPPPSSGGLHVIQILKLLEKVPLTEENFGFLKPNTLHWLASSMQIAYADRAVHLGDPDFVTVPQKGLIHPTYLDQRRSEILKNRARTKNEVSAGPADEFEEEANTTHFSIMDQEGNVVVSTQTINGWFGSGLVAAGTGIVLNNEMDDFSAKPGNANIFGAVGGDANAIEPKKTPLSSMSPTIVFKNNKPVLALGAPGGTRIITSVVQTILNHLVFQKDLYTSVATARIHQQWSPDILQIEHYSDSNRPEVTASTASELKKLGWQIVRKGAQSNIMAVARRVSQKSGQPNILPDELIGVSDPRDAGTSAAE